MKKVKHWFMRIFIWPLWDRLASRCDGCPCCYTAWVDNDTGYAESACMFGGEPEGCLRSMKERTKKADAQKADNHIDAIMEGIGWEFTELMHYSAKPDIVTALEKDVHALYKIMREYKALAEAKARK